MKMKKTCFDNFRGSCFPKNDCVSLLRKEMSGVLVCSNKLQRNVLAGRQCSYGCGINYMVVIIDMEEKSMR